ncbi:MAG: hypothetical protein RIQ60_31 [Pseudomonadota bacterium]|jgi:hypothetical protein
MFRADRSASPARRTSLHQQVATLTLALAAATTLLTAQAAGPAAPTAASAASASTAGPNIAQLPAANIAARAERARLSNRVWRHEDSAELKANDAPALSDDPQVIELGRLLYTEGRRADGSLLVAQRLQGQTSLTGSAAACVLCHRRSGLGAVEGTSAIAPITGRYLFDQDRRSLVNMNLRARKSFNHRHEPYSLDTLGQALRDGRHESGRELDDLMPRYQLNDAEVLALASYLRHLSNRWSAGVTDKTVRLATIVTPDVDARRRSVFLDTFNAIVAQKNGNIVRGQRSMSSAAEMALQTDRQWDVQVWELKGPAATWGAQLDQLQREQPVFAIASGLGGANWSPVHAFCERQALPCWFPSIGVAPAESDSDFYSVYFSRGATLEADVLARRLEDRPAAARNARLLQVYAEPSLAAGPVATLRERLADSGLKLQEMVLDASRVGTLKQALAGLGDHDSVVFWLTPAQLPWLAGLDHPKARSYFSAALGGGDQIDLPTAWREQALLLYPYQLPAQRQRALNYFHDWLRTRNLAATDEVLQSEVYFSLSYLNDTLVDMLDNMHRDYLLERGENMLSLREAAKAEDEAREFGLPKSNTVPSKATPLRQMAQRMMIPRPAAPRAGAVPSASALAGNNISTRGQGPLLASAGSAQGPVVQAGYTDEAVEQAARSSATSDAVSDKAAASDAAQGTTVYPRLSLGQFQRHASKGAYIVRPGSADHPEPQVAAGWLVP